jgi:hypothetical protein
MCELLPERHTVRIRPSAVEYFQKLTMTTFLYYANVFFAVIRSKAKSPFVKPLFFFRFFLEQASTYAVNCVNRLGAYAILMGERIDSMD